MTHETWQKNIQTPNNPPTQGENDTPLAQGDNDTPQARGENVRRSRRVVRLPERLKDYDLSK